MVLLSLLALGLCSGAFVRHTLSPLQESLQLDLILSDGQIAVLQGPALAIPLAIGAIPLGLIADRYSRRRLVLLATLLNLAATLLTAAATDFMTLIVARGMAGLGIAGLFVAAFSMISDLFSPTERGRATTVLSVGEVAGAPAAFALGGALLAMTGPASESWREAVLWMAIPLACFSTAAFLLREPPRVGTETVRPGLAEAWPTLWRCRAIVFPLLFARIMIFLADGAAVIWTAPVLSRKFDLPPDQIGGMIAAALLFSGVAGPLIGGALADYCQKHGGSRRAMVAMGMISLLSIPPAFFAVFPSPMLVGIGLGVFLTLGFMCGTLAMALTLVAVPGEVRGTFVALTVTVGSLTAVGLAPMIISTLSGVLGGPAALGSALALVGSVMSCAAAIIFMLASRTFPSETGDVG
ncbi:MFS transporter [Sphingomonas suaedae]|nr:MFS transporter [Sphingomonas suaedae]